MPDIVRIESDQLAVEVSSLGAEMQSLRTRDGRSWGWHGDPAFWAGRSPILFPIAVKLGVHPVHLGILMVVNMEVGMCHPPVGLNLYVASGIAKLGITELTIAVWPWLLTMLGFLVAVTFIPELSLWLPRTLGMLN